MVKRPWTILYEARVLRQGRRWLVDLPAVLAGVFSIFGVASIVRGDEDTRRITVFFFGVVALCTGLAFLAYRVLSLRVRVRSDRKLVVGSTEFESLRVEHGRCRARAGDAEVPLLWVRVEDSAGRSVSFRRMLGALDRAPGTDHWPFEEERRGELALSAQRVDFARLVRALEQPENR